MRVKTYHWQITNVWQYNQVEGVREFNYNHFCEASNHPLPSDRQIGNEAFAMPLELALKLVNKWNANSEGWKYWLD